MDFKYERLPYYCYACGKIGHCAKQCQDVPFDEDKMEEHRVAYWIEVEAKEYSPYWKIFYGKIEDNSMEEETIP